MKRRALTPKQRVFVAEYMVDLNATQAAVRAGYGARNADVSGPRLLATPAVAAEVSRRQQARLDKLDIKADDVLRELAFVAMQRASMFFDDDGNMLPIHKLPPAADAALADHEMVMGNLDAGDGRRDRIVKIRKWSKTDALMGLAKHFGLLTEKVEHLGAVQIEWKAVE